MKNKMKKKSFWVGLAAAVILVLQLVGIKINAPYVNEVMSAACALFVFLGLVKDDTGKDEVLADEESGKETIEPKIEQIADNSDTNIN